MLGILAAGAAQGFGEADKRNVDMHNKQALMNQEIGLREQLREQYAQRRFNEQRKAQREDAKIAAQYNEAQYKRERQDNLSDAEREREYEMKKLGIQESGKDRRTAMKMKAQGQKGLLEGGKARSTTGKTVQDLLDLGLADTPQEAYDLYEESGLAKMIASSPTVINPEQIMEHMQQWRKARGSNRNVGQTQKNDNQRTFVRNPETGKLELSR